MASLVKENPGSKTFKVLGELVADLETRKTKYETLDSGSKIPAFSQNADGKLEMVVGGNKFTFTGTGFDRFCKLIRVPSKFVLKLPYENVVKDLTASLIASELEKISCIVQDDTIIGASSREEPLTPTEVIQAAYKDTTSKEFADIALSDGFVITNFTRKQDALPFNEVIKTGLSVVHDFASGNPPSLEYYWQRLICTNGNVARKFITLGRFSKKMTRTKILETLSERINKNLEDRDFILKDSIVKMRDTKIQPDDIKYLKSYLSSKMDWENHGDILNNYTIQIKDGSTYYDLMNLITDGAKGYDSVDKLGFEMLGGTMVEYFLPVKPTSEILPGYCEFKRKLIHREKTK